MSKLLKESLIYIYIYISGKKLWKGGCLLTNKTISLLIGGAYYESTL